MEQPLENRTHQPAAARRCTSCNRWGGEREADVATDQVLFSPSNDRGPCIEGPWDGTLRSSRNACGRWLKWVALAPDTPPPPG